MMKTLAFFSPLSPLPSGVAVYADRLAAQLAGEWKIIFYIDDGYTPAVAGGLGEIRNHREFRGNEDLALFQASNGAMHAYMYPYILKYGGVITLHDATLYDMVLKYWEGRPRTLFWKDFLQSEGISGLKRALAPLPEGGGTISQRILHNIYMGGEINRYSFTFLSRLADRAAGIIAHSRWVADAAKKAGADCPIMVTPLAVESVPTRMTTGDARNSLDLKKWGINENTFVMVAYGYIQRHKRIGPILDALVEFTAEAENVKLLLIGPRSPDLDIDEAIAQRSLEKKVFIDSSFPALEKVYRYIYSADLCLNLRKPVHGSTSQTLMEILATGRACAVTDLETFSEFDSKIVKKIKDGADETEQILDAFRWARDYPEEREAMGKHARKYVEGNCLWSLVGKKYNMYLEEASGSS